MRNPTSFFANNTLTLAAQVDPTNEKSVMLFLNKIQPAIESNAFDLEENLETLFRVLAKVFSQCSTDEWNIFAAIVQKHPLQKILLECPFTKRINDKPRGYAGDAVVLDYIYYGIPVHELPHITPRGQRICNFTINTPAARAVRNRARMIGEMVDAAYEQRVEKGDTYRVLSIAAGHLREMSTSKRFNEGKVEVMAIDQDIESLTIIATDYAQQNIITKHTKIQRLLKDPQFVASLGKFDFVYASGLFDYLDEATTASLTKVMYQLTRPAGTTLLTNFMDGIINRGQMESYISWNLIYRNSAQMLQFLKLIDCQTFTFCRDNTGNIGFIVCKKNLTPEAELLTSDTPLLKAKEYSAKLPCKL